MILVYLFSVGGPAGGVFRAIEHPDGKGSHDASLEVATTDGLGAKIWAKKSWDSHLPPQPDLARRALALAMPYATGERVEIANPIHPHTPSPGITTIDLGDWKQGRGWR